MEEERDDYYQSSVRMNDFAVEIRNIPSLKDYDTIDELKVQLATHIQRMLDSDRQVCNDKSGSEVVSIHFATT